MIHPDGKVTLSEITKKEEEEEENDDKAAQKVATPNGNRRGAAPKIEKALSVRANTHALPTAARRDSLWGK